MIINFILIFEIITKIYLNYFSPVNIENKQNYSFNGENLDGIKKVEHSANIKYKSINKDAWLYIYKFDSVRRICNFSNPVNGVYATLNDVSSNDCMKRIGKKIDNCIYRYNKQLPSTFTDKSSAAWVNKIDTCAETTLITYS